ncbi:hypothetical protein ACQPW3_23765 [Actinosynnema sp. CA-248983]
MGALSPTRANLVLATLFLGMFTVAVAWGTGFLKPPEAVPA